MTELLRLARALRTGCEDPRTRFAHRCDLADPRAAFTHRLRVGLAVAALILILSLLR